MATTWQATTALRESVLAPLGVEGYFGVEPRALPRSPGIAGRSANLGAMAVARQPCFASATHYVRAPKAFPSSSIYPFPGMPRSSIRPASPAQSA